jgi:iron complex outermembrane recepter protein
MTKFRYKVGALGLLASAVTAPHVALAQTTGLDTVSAADIVVTAQKRAQTLSDVPISVTAQTGEQLIDKGISDVQGLVLVTPGLSFVDSGRGVPVLSLRGVGFFDQSIGARPTVSVYADEAPLPFALMARAASFDLERVEVLKGPQGTLFGQSSTGGAINYIAAKPTADFAAGVVASYGRFDTISGQGYISGPLSPTLAARIAVNAVHSGPSQYSYTRNDQLGRQDFVQGRLLLDWSPGDTFRVQVNVNGFIDRSEQVAPQLVGVRRLTPVTAPIAAYPLPPRDNRAADWNPGRDYRRNNRFYQGTLRADYEISDALTLTSLTSYSNEKIFIPSDGDGTTLVGFEQTLGGTAKSFSQELRASGDAGPLHYLIGGNYSSDRTEESNGVYQLVANGAYVNGLPLLDRLSALINQRFKTYAAFADGTFSVTDQLRLTGGIRYTKQDLNYDGCLTVDTALAAGGYTIVVNRTRAANGLGPIPTLTVGACATLDTALLPARAFGKQVEDNISWRAGIDFKPTPRTLLYVNINKGFKSGSAPAPAAAAIAQFQPARQESVMAYEAGIKTSLFDRKVDLTGAAFYYDYKDKQLLGRSIYQPDVFGAVTALVNVPKSHVFGIEGQATVRPVQGMTLSAAATYLDTKVDVDFSNYSITGVLINFRGQAFPYTPKWQLSFEGENRIPLSPSMVGTFGWNLTYRTATTAGFGSDPRLAIDPYYLLDLRAGIEAADGRWKVQAYGRNVLDEYYWTNIAVGADAIRRHTGLPATYGVQLSFKF